MDGKYAARYNFSFRHTAGASVAHPLGNSFDLFLLLAEKTPNVQGERLIARNTGWAVNRETDRIGLFRGFRSRTPNTDRFADILDQLQCPACPL